MTPANPADDWKALTENYRSMGDGELEELALSLNDLTPTAQQVLRDEMKLRGLGDPLAPGWNAQRGPAVADEQDGAQSESGPAIEYTWKTQLCATANPAEAWQITEVLRRAGIESWLDKPSAYSPYSDLDGNGPRVLVAADQIEEARDVVSRPIPQDIIEQSQLSVPEYDLPTCPRCGAADPVLENADPVNQWKCESCGAEWTEAGPETGDGDVNDSK